MRALASRLLHEATGQDLETWNRRVEREGPADEKLLRIWLSQRGVTGFTQSYLIVERFGYPDDLAATADELVDGLFADRPAMKPLYDALVEAASGLGDHMLQARKSHVSLHSPLRMFARVEVPATDRLDLYLRLEGISPHGRLQASSDHVNLPVFITLRRREDLDAEVIGWLEQAYAENS